jgi:hypothetical protein
MSEKLIKKSKDGKERMGRKLVVKVLSYKGKPIYMEKTSHRLVVY